MATGDKFLYRQLLLNSLFELGWPSVGHLYDKLESNKFEHKDQ